MDQDTIMKAFNLTRIDIKANATNDKGGPCVYFEGPGITHIHCFGSSTTWENVYAHLKEYLDKGGNRCKSIWEVW